MPDQVKFVSNDTVCFNASLPIDCEPNNIGFNVIPKTDILQSLSFMITNIQNPYSFKPSLPFRAIYTTDKDDYNSQAAKDLSLTRLKTTVASQISDYTITQQLDDYNMTGTMTI